MLNPVLSNTQFHFTDDLFPESITKKYNDYLFLQNSPIKTIGGLIYESIQNVEIPGISLQTITAQALNNMGKSQPFGKNGEFPHTTINIGYPGTANVDEILDNHTLTLTMLNRLVNWMYFYEACHAYYKRTRQIDLFDVVIIALDSAEIPTIKFHFRNCFITTLPGLSFSMNSAFNESKTFDVGIFFNKLDVAFLIPNFNLTTINF